MTLGDVTPELVAQLYPLAPAVTALDVQAASDWAEIENAGLPLPEAGGVKYRELQRAVAAYALYLVTGGRAASLRLTTSAGAGALKSIALGTLKFERAAVNTEVVAQGVALSAAEWLEIAGQHLTGAGILTGWAFPGTSR